MTREGGGTRPRAVEIELKYRLRDLVAGERYVGAEELAGMRPVASTRTTQLEDRYVDTADGALARSGFAARLRVSTAGTIVSVKSTARRVADRGPHRREELEGPADRTSGPRDWPPSDARSLILELCGDAPLVELVTIRQLRRRRELRDGRTAVELSLDEVDVVARSQVVARFAELEAELVRGDEGRLMDVAGVLDADPALETSPGSKLEAALDAVRSHVRRHGPLPEVADATESDGSGEEVGPRLRRAPTHVTAQPMSSARASHPGRAAPPSEAHAERSRPSPTLDEPSGTRVEAAAGSVAAASVAQDPAAEGRAADEPARGGPEAPHPPRLSVGRTPGVSADDPVAEAGRKVLRFHLARMFAREPGTREGHDPEELHGMRVATRRMRAAWRVFGDGFRPGRTRRYRSRLREVAGRLGAVRDLDVLIDGLTTYAEALPATERRGLKPLVAGWQGYRNDARGLLIHELDSAAYARFVEDFRVFVQTEGAGARPIGPTEPHHVRDTAPSRIWSAYERVRAHELVVRWADVETLHDLRIAAKWLRYSLEFVREALGPGAELLIPRVVALQDHLGKLHDADVGAAMGRTFLAERAGGLSPIESAAIGRYVLAQERELARLRRAVGAPWRGVAGIAFRQRLGRAVAGF